MSTIEETKQTIKENVKLSVKKDKVGGQHTNIPDYPVILISDELQVEITIGFYRSQLKNKNLALTLFELTLDELIK